MKIIVLEKNIEESEVNIFINFLNSKEYPQHKSIVFSNFPELKEMLKDVSGEKEKEILWSFLKKTRENNKENIEKSVNYIKGVVNEKGEKMLSKLASLMNYEWKPDNNNYYLLPTIYPTCPFQGNTFFYSIINSLRGITEYPKVLAVSAHEISHFIFFNLLQERNQPIGKELIYFVKELIAPILVNQDDFNGIFDKAIVGNYNVLEIFFDDNGKIIKAFDYFSELFTKNRSEKKDFRFFLEKMILISKKIEPEIIEKSDFDKKYGIQIMKDPELLKIFRKPIKLE